MVTFFKPKQRSKLSKAGFTLVETLMAVSILVLAVTGAFSAAQSGISSSIFSKDQVIAFYLAAEGVEMIRSIRDENGLAGLTTDNNWLTGISQGSGAPCAFNQKCKVDAVARAISSCSGTCPVLKLSPEGFYGYASGADTVFRREITITQINPHEVSILVSVQWSKGLTPRNFKVRENIFNWQ